MKRWYMLQSVMFAIIIKNYLLIKYIKIGVQNDLLRDLAYLSCRVGFHVILTILCLCSALTFSIHYWCILWHLLDFKNRMKRFAAESQLSLFWHMCDVFGRCVTLNLQPWRDQYERMCSLDGMSATCIGSVNATAARTSNARVREMFVCLCFAVPSVWHIEMGHISIDSHARCLSLHLQCILTHDGIS